MVVELSPLPCLLHQDDNMGAEFDAQARDAEAEVEAEHEQLVAQVSGEGRLGAVAEG